MQGGTGNLAQQQPSQHHPAQCHQYPEAGTVPSTKRFPKAGPSWGPGGINNVEQRCPMNTEPCTFPQLHNQKVSLFQSLKAKHVSL